MFRSEREREEMLLIQKPVGVRQAFGQFGLVLGGIPAAAVFYRLLVALKVASEVGAIWFAVAMLVICLATGRAMGQALSKSLYDIERGRWSTMLILSALLGLCWGAVTGAAGGVIVFVIGAAPGALIAALVGGIAFPMFVSMHRLLSRGGQIESHQLTALAFGISSIIAAFVLGL